MEWAKTTARRDEKPLSFGICCELYYRFYGMGVGYTQTMHTMFCGTFSYGYRIIFVIWGDTFTDIRHDVLIGAEANVILRFPTYRWSTPNENG